MLGQVTLVNETASDIDQKNVADSTSFDPHAGCRTANQNTSLDFLKSMQGFVLSFDNPAHQR